MAKLYAALQAIFGRGAMLTRSIALRVPAAFPQPRRGRIMAETDRTKWRPKQARPDGPPENED